VERSHESGRQLTGRKKATTELIEEENGAALGSRGWRGLGPLAARGSAVGPAHGALKGARPDVWPP
jgi:hypothetical protein